MADSCEPPLAVLPPGLAIVGACWLVHQWPGLPPAGVPVALMAAGAALWLFALCVGGRARGAPGRAIAVTDTVGRVLAFAAAGLAAAGWAAHCAQQRLDERLDPALEGQELTVVGIVEDMPQASERGQRFRFRIERCVAPQAPCPGRVSVRLGWHQGLFGRPAVASVPVVPVVHPGERWQLRVRLKRPHATSNPGLFDAELRALEDGIAATGNVRQVRGDITANRRLDAFVPTPGTLVERARDAIRAAMLAAMRDAPAAARGVLVALAVGDQGAVPAEWWERFNRTGVGHLMSISGLHITMLAALGGRLAGMLWGSAALAALMRRPLPSWCPVPHVRWCAGLATGFGYAALAGWGIPAQRTCWMLAAAGLAMVTGRARATVPVLSTAAAVVCLMDPWAPMAAGFWLSFAAVGAIIWFGARRGRVPVEPAPTRPADRGEEAPPARARAAARIRDWRQASAPMLREALRSQVAATVSLLPLGVVFFASVSLVGPFANAFAIPLVSAVITPLALAGAALALAWTPLGAVALGPGAWLGDLLLASLRWIDLDGAGAVAVPTPDATALALAVAACGVLLAPWRVPGRWVAAFGLCPMLLAQADAPSPGELRLVALDVGQGSAVLVETAHGRLLYDTGPELGPDSDAGSRTIVPYLRSRGIARLEALVVSHQDADHAGGAPAVLAAQRIDWVASSLPDAHPAIAGARRRLACVRGERWQWGDVAFEWLHPGEAGEPSKGSPTNARSCVLRIRSPAGSVLLAGDIEAPQEKRLLELFPPQALQADVLLAPHHGSRTSSLPAFLDAVAPGLAIFQLGYRNRYRHPHPAILERYRERGITILRSDAHGAITVRMAPGQEPQVERWRVDRPRYWRVRVAPLDPHDSGVPAARKPDAAAMAPTGPALAGAAAPGTDRSWSGRVATDVPAREIARQPLPGATIPE